MKHKNKSIKILLSFDHELSLGSVDSYHRNLFEPTDKLFDLANELAVPLNLFTDILSASKFKQWDYSGFYKPYKQQLQKALKESHDVQLHIHPHWLDTDYIDGKFIPSSNYTLAAFSHREPPYDIYGILSSGIQHLNEICKEANENYRCIAYRGGGYNLQPKTKEILKSLLKLGIRIDSSIIKGMHFTSQVNFVDFSQTPKKANWFISPEFGISKESKTGIYEVPIASSSRNFINSIPFLVKRVINKKHAYQSTGRGIVAQTSSISNRLNRLFFPDQWTVSFDSHARSAHEILQTLRHYIHKHKDDEVIYCSACSHPKSMGTYQRTIMAEFISRARDEFKDKIEFVTYQKTHDDLAL